MAYAKTDLFLRHRAKVSPTDLWLHPAGVSGSTPLPIRDDGTVITTALLEVEEALADSGKVTTVADLAVVESLVASGDLSTASLFESVEALVDQAELGSTATFAEADALATESVLTTVATFALAAALATAGQVTGVALLSGDEALADGGDTASVAVFDAQEAFGDLGLVATVAAFDYDAELIDGVEEGTVVTVAFIEVVSSLDLPLVRTFAVLLPHAAVAAVGSLVRNASIWRRAVADVEREVAGGIHRKAKANAPGEADADVKRLRGKARILP